MDLDEAVTIISQKLDSYDSGWRDVVSTSNAIIVKAISSLSDLVEALNQKKDRAEYLRELLMLVLKLQVYWDRCVTICDHALSGSGGSIPDTEWGTLRKSWDNCVNLGYIPLMNWPGRTLDVSSEFEEQFGGLEKDKQRIYECLDLSRRLEVLEAVRSFNERLHKLSAIVRFQQDKTGLSEDVE